MKKPKEKKNVSIIVTIGLIVLLTGSVLSLFTFEKPAEKINVNYQIVLLSNPYPAQSAETAQNTTIYDFLTNLGASFEDDGDVKCVNNYCNNFMAKYYWQAFLNNAQLDDFTKELENDDNLVLYYGEMINFYNITLDLDINGMIENANITVQEGLTINDLLSSYNSTFENNTLNCLFGFCNNANNTWSVLLNNESVNDYSTPFMEGDVLGLKY